MKDFKPSETSNLYLRLNVEYTATQKEIKHAFKSLALRYHPDKNGEVKEFLAIKEAYDILSNSTRKEEYDKKDEFRRYIGNDIHKLYELCRTIFSDLKIMRGNGYIRIEGNKKEEKGDYLYKKIINIEVTKEKFFDKSDSYHISIDELIEELEKN